MASEVRAALEALARPTRLEGAGGIPRRVLPRGGRLPLWRCVVGVRSVRVICGIDSRGPASAAHPDRSRCSRSPTCPGDPEQEYFADGMTEELITDLAPDPVAQGDLAHVGHALQDTRSSRSARSRRRWVSTRSSRARCCAPATGCASRRSSSTRRATTTCGPRATSATFSDVLTLAERGRARHRAGDPAAGVAAGQCQAREARDACNPEAYELLPAGASNGARVRRRCAQGDRVLRAGTRDRSGRSRATAAASRDAYRRCWCRSSAPSRRRRAWRRSRSTRAERCAADDEPRPRATPRWRRRCSSATGTGRKPSDTSPRDRAEPRLLDGPPHLLALARRRGPRGRGDRAGSPGPRAGSVLDDHPVECGLDALHRPPIRPGARAGA